MDLQRYVKIRSDGSLIESQYNNQYYFIGEFNKEGYARVGIAGGYQIIDRDGQHIDDNIYDSLRYIEKQNIFIGELLGNLCLINRDGKIMVEAQKDYDELYYPSCGRRLVSKDGKYGYIDMDGEEVIPLQYDSAYEFSRSGLAFVIKPIYESGSVFNYGLAAVSKDGEYIFIYENGDRAMSLGFKYAGGFAESGLAKNQLFDGRQSLIRTDGSVILLLKKECELSEFVGSSLVTKFEVNGKKALINDKGEKITGLNYDEIIISSDSNLHPFLRDGLWGYIDDSGKEVIKNIYKLASGFAEDGTAQVGIYHPLEENKIKKVYINDRDEIVEDDLVELFYGHLKDKFSKVYRFKDGRALAIKKGKTKILNAYGKEIQPKGFDIGLEDGSLFIYPEEGQEELDSYEDHYEEDYSRDGEFKGYIDEEGNAIGFEFEVYIELKGDWSKEETREFIEKGFDKENILQVGPGTAKILWKMPAWASDGDLEVEMYYFLEDGKLGDYEYFRVN